MTERRVEEAEVALALELLSFVEDGVHEILLREDEGEFLAWVRAEAPRRLPGLFADLPNEQAARAIAFDLGREIWNKVPLPGAGYRTRPIPRPERNEPCPCGSGQKYKKCCGAVSGGRFELPLQAEEIWALVLPRRPEEEVAQLAAERRVPRALLPGIAENLFAFGAAETALVLLESFLFEAPESLDERDAPALDALIEAYDDLDLPAEKERALERLDGALRPPLRLALWESLAQSYLSQGEAERAQAAAEQIRRLDSDNPVLGWVETLLFLENNELPEASERARDALQRHRRRPGLSDEALAFLQATAEDPKASRRRLLLDDLLPGVEGLEKLVGDASGRPIRPYDVHAEDDNPGSGRLIAPEDLPGVEDAWMAATVGVEWEEPEEDEEEDDWDEGEIDDEEDDDEEADWEEDDDEEDWLEQEAELFWEPDEAERWLGWLSSNPQAFDSLVILGDLADRASMLAEIDPEIVETLVRPLVSRGVAIVEASLAGAPRVTLAGDAEENEAALDLLDAAALLSGKPRRIEERGTPEE